MQIVFRLQKLLFQHEIQFGEARVLLGQGKDRFVNDGQANGCLNPAATPVNLDVQAGCITGTIEIEVIFESQGKIISPVDQYQPRIPGDDT